MQRAKTAELAELHERLLYQRAYPATEEDVRQADGELERFPALMEELRASGADMAPLEEHAVSGMAGCGMTAVFSYGVAWHLVKRHGACVRIAWEAWERPEALGCVLGELAPLVREVALVEAHVDWERWVGVGAGRRPGLEWLLSAMKRRWPEGREAAERYDNLQLPVRWEFGASCATRTLMRLPVKTIFYHTGPAMTRGDVRLDEIPSMAPMETRQLGVGAGEMVLALARDTSAVRYRELHGFTWGDPRCVVEIRAGRGVQFFLSCVAAAQQLPLRSYHAMSIWKNGVPIGYFEGLSIQERMEAGFNLYYTFRAGETAWLYGQVLRACHQVLGARCFVVDPYQLGHENEEAIESGAVWFYRKLGFRPVVGEIAQLMEREERRLAAKKGLRSPASTLRRLAAGPMIYEFPQTATGEWDGFEVERAVLRLAGRRRLPKGLERAELIALGRP